jgi:outer membrane protein assembly factor BamA
VRSLALALLLAALVLAPSRAAADLPPELEGRPVVAVEVLGEARGLLDADDLHLSLGTALTRTSLRRAVLELLASGEWADVLLECEETAGGVLVRVTLVPRVLLTRIELEGNESLSDQAVLDVLGVHEDGEVVPDRLGAMRAALKDELALRGFVGAEVELSLRDTDSPSRKVLRVVVREGEPLRVSELRFVAIGGGLESPSLTPPEDAELPAAIGLGDGDVLDRTRLEDGLRHAETQLRERGYLEARVDDASIDPARGVVAVPVRIGHRYRVEIRGHAPLDRTNVEEVLQLSAERLTRPVVEDVRLRIVDLYQRHGFLRPTVVLRRTLDPQALRPEDGEPDPRFAVLRVEIAPGERTRVVGVSFPGATHFAPELLRDQIRSYLDEDLPSSQPFEPVDDEVVDRLVTGRTTARRGVAQHIVDVPASVWMESTYAEAVGHITELYQAAGYLDASVGPAELRELEDGVAVVTVPVYEGPRTLVYDVRVAGNELLSTHELLEATRIQRGEPFGYITLEEARRRVLALYQDRGHFFARVAPVVHRSGDRERAEIVIEVVEGYPVHVGEIRVEGIASASEDLVRQALHFGPGDLYRPDVVRQSEDALLRLGVFSSVSITPVDPDLPERVKDVVVTVAERLPQELALSAGIGTGEGARGSFEYTYRNLFGYAVSLSLRAQLAFQFFFQDQELREAFEGRPPLTNGPDDLGRSPLSLLDRLERRITIGIAVPYIPGLRDVRAGLDFVHLRDNFRDFGLDKNGAVLTLTYQPERRFTGSLSTEVEQNTVGLFDSSQTLEDFLAMTTDPRLQRLLRVPAGVSALASVRRIVRGGSARQRLHADRWLLCLCGARVGAHARDRARGGLQPLLQAHADGQRLHPPRRRLGARAPGARRARVPPRAHLARVSEPRLLHGRRRLAPRLPPGPGDPAGSGRGHRRRATCGHTAAGLGDHAHRRDLLPGSRGAALPDRRGSAGRRVRRPRQRVGLRGRDGHRGLRERARLRGPGPSPLDARRSHRRRLRREPHAPRRSGHPEPFGAFHFSIGLF